METNILNYYVLDYLAKETSWNCPSAGKVGQTCVCYAAKATIHCNGPTFQQLNHFFDELKTINNASING